jgi:predicted nucleic acid-binding protein
MSDVDLFFIDTNVHVYAFDAGNLLKQRQTRKWLDAIWRAGAGRVSWQVLHEFYVNATKGAGIPAPAARSVVLALAEWSPMDSSQGLVHRAWHWIDVAHLSYWDALIMAGAELSGCRYLLSEGFQAERNFEGVTVVNPFLSSPSDFGLPEEDHHLV